MEYDEKNSGRSKTLILVLGAVVIVLIVIISVLATLLVTGNKDSIKTTGEASTETMPEQKESHDVDESNVRTDNYIKAAYMVVSDDKIYWGYDERLCEADIEKGGALSNISEYGRMEDDIDLLAMKNGVLYFNCYDGIYRVALGESLEAAEQIVSHKSIDGFWLTENKIYFDEDEILYCTDLSGGNIKEIVSDVESYILSESGIYYISDQDEFLKTDWDGKSRDRLEKLENVEEIVIHNQDIYVAGEKLWVYHTDKGTLEKVPISETIEDDEEILVTDDYILYEAKNGDDYQYSFKEEKDENMNIVLYAGNPYSVQYKGYLYYSFHSGNVTCLDLETLDYETYDADNSLFESSRETKSVENEKSNNSVTAGYDIAANLAVRLTDGVGLVQSDYINLVMPYDDLADGLWEIEADSTSSISFYYSKARASGNGGFVFSIEAYDWGDNSYEDYPHYVIGNLSEDKKYIVVFPTDVQYNINDSIQKEEYERLKEFAEQIYGQNSDNPLSIIQ